MACLHTLKSRLIIIFLFLCAYCFYILFLSRCKPCKHRYYVNHFYFAISCISHVHNDVKFILALRLFFVPLVLYWRLGLRHRHLWESLQHSPGPVTGREGACYPKTPPCSALQASSFGLLGLTTEGPYLTFSVRGPSDRRPNSDTPYTWAFGPTPFTL